MHIPKYRRILEKLSNRAEGVESDIALLAKEIGALESRKILLEKLLATIIVHYVHDASVEVDKSDIYALEPYMLQIDSTTRSLFPCTVQVVLKGGYDGAR